MTVTSDKKLDADDETPDGATSDAPTSGEATTDNDAVDEDGDAVDKDGDAVDEVDTPSDDEQPGRRWPRRVIVGVLAALLVAALATSGYLGFGFWQQREVNRAGQQAQEAAVAYAQVLTSIDSNKVDDNFNQVLDGATGEFKDMYSQSSMQLRQLLIDNKASARGVVIESAIQSQTKNKVVVLLFVDQSVSNTAVPDPRIDRSRIKMTMEYADGRWRASKVELR